VLLVRGDGIGDKRMGRYVKERGEGASTYYWYPGQKTDWVQAAIALGSGLAAAAVVRVATGSMMWSAAVGFSMAAALAGTYLGRRDARALAVTNVSRLSGAVLLGLAFLRALAKGSGAALAAIVISRVATPGFPTEWLLPLVPAVIGAIAHHLGMFYENLEKVAAVQVKASESEFAKAAAERRERAAAAPTPQPAEIAAATDDPPSPSSESAVGANVQPGLAGALPGEVDDRSRPGAGPETTAYRAEGSGRRYPANGRRAVFSRRRPGMREVV
jgi:hypothetical protein